MPDGSVLGNKCRRWWKHIEVPAFTYYFKHHHDHDNENDGKYDDDDIERAGAWSL